MLTKYTKISYYEIDDFIFKLSRGVDISIWKEYDRFNNYKEKAELLLTPFLKELIIKSRCYSIILKEYCGDDFYRESICCSKDDFYIEIEDDEWYDEDEDESNEYKENYENIQLSREIRLSDLIKAIKNNQSIQKFTNLNKLSSNAIKDIDRFCYEVYTEEYKEDIKNIRFRYLEIDKFLLDKRIKEKLIGNYDKYPILSVLATYHYLIESNDLINLICDKLNKIILSCGFISCSEKYVYDLPDRRKFSKSIEKIEALIYKKDITINSFKKYILDGIKDDIVDNDLANVHFNMVNMSKIDGITFLNLNDIDEEKVCKHLNMLHPFKYKNASYYKFDKESDIRKVENTKFNFAGENYMIFEAKIIPKCYSHSVSYIIQVNYSFDEQGRFLFLKDNMEDNLIEEEFKNLPILVHEINIYNSRIVNKDLN